jgi:hypothetical protein
MLEQGMYKEVYEINKTIETLKPLLKNNFMQEVKQTKDVDFNKFRKLWIMQ